MHLISLQELWPQRLSHFEYKVKTVQCKVYFLCLLTCEFMLCQE